MSREQKILVMMPTRERLRRAARTYRSWEETRSGVSDFCMILDADNVEEYSDLASAIDGSPQGKTMVIARDADTPVMETGLQWALNECWRRHPGYLGYMLCSDDLLFRSAKWDSTFWLALMGKDLKDLKDGRDARALLVWGDDSRHGAELPTHPALSGRFCEALGWFACPDFRHYYLDTVWMVVVAELDRIRKGKGIEQEVTEGTEGAYARYLPGVFTEHCHPDSQGQSWRERYPEDELARRNLMVSREEIREQRIWKWWKREEFPAVVERVRKKLQVPSSKLQRINEQVAIEQVMR